VRDADCPVFDFIGMFCVFGVAGFEDEGELCSAVIACAGWAFL
jgi:hypothetical protein